MSDKKVIRRKRVKHVLTFEERLLAAASQARDSARKLPPGTERETLLRLAHDSETALHMNRLMSSPRAAPPSSPARRA
jgi:hypothetical protein